MPYPTVGQQFWAAAPWCLVPPLAGLVVEVQCPGSILITPKPIIASSAAASGAKTVGPLFRPVQDVIESVLFPLARWFATGCSIEREADRRKNPLL